MTDKELMQELNRLKSIEPDKKYAGISKSFILQIRNIKPDAAYAEESKRIILTVPRLVKAGFDKVLSPFRFVYSTLSYASSVVLTVTLMALIASVSGYFLNISPVPTGLDDGLVMEANQVINNIDGHLGRVEYNEKTTTATEEPPKVTKTQIHTNKKIDQLLQEAAD